jgi:hypothetical protein
MVNCFSSNRKPIQWWKTEDKGKDKQITSHLFHEMLYTHKVEWSKFIFWYSQNIQVNTSRPLIILRYLWRRQKSNLSLTSLYPSCVCARVRACVGECACVCVPFFWILLFFSQCWGWNPGPTNIKRAYYHWATPSALEFFFRFHLNLYINFSVIPLCIFSDCSEDCNIRSLLFFVYLEQIYYFT